jgi:hypothetical protein
VGLYGGFRGYEILRSQRNADPLTGGTTLSGDLLGDDEYPFANADLFDDNTNIVISAGSDISPSTIVDGFIIMGGYNPDGDGAGLNSTGFPTLKNLFFYGNQAYHGGAIWLGNTGEEHMWRLENCIFTGNLARHPENTYVYGYGGAIYTDWADGTNPNRLLLQRCEFIDNYAFNRGGAVFIDEGTEIDVDDCLFRLNKAVQPNAAQQKGYGGAIYIHSFQEARISRTRFLENQTDVNGGAVYALDADVLVSQCVFWENACGEYGSGMYAGINEYDGTLRIVNTTVAYNRTADPSIGSAIYFVSNSAGSVDNSILWGNTNADVVVPSAKKQIYTGSSTVRVRTSCVQHYSTYALTSGPGNTGDDPAFKNSGAGDLRLTADSGCIDNGNDYVDADPITPNYQPLPVFDLAGALRIVDGDDNGIANVDMGAYEYQP